MPLNFPFEFDFKNPDYTAVWNHRLEKLEYLRAHPEKIPIFKAYYTDHIAQFIIDWGVTYDPRNVARGLPSSIPFLLFKRQEEYVAFIIRKWLASEPGLVEKSRDMGVSWLNVAISCSLCLFHDGIKIGFGSAKRELVDVTDDPKTLFHKAREFMKGLPDEFTNGFSPSKDTFYMKMLFRQTNAGIFGEGGDSIGRGDRTSLHMIDEAAHLVNPIGIDAALSETTECQIDVSSCNGMNNPFAEKRFSGRVEVFTFNWRSDPRKDDAWYQKRCRDKAPWIVAQEVDIDYNASTQGSLIPAIWVQSAIDAHKKLNIDPTGKKVSALDIADEGEDLNGFIGRYGILANDIQTWSGKGSDIYRTVERAFGLCDAESYEELRFDGSGLGAGVKGDARQLNEKRAKLDIREISVNGFISQGAVFDPEGELIDGRKNKDMFANLKAQGWWSLRIRFQKTFRAVVEGLSYEPDEIISISSAAENQLKLASELSQPAYSVSPTTGKILINKQPNGTKSPNLGDACMIVYFDHTPTKTKATNNYFCTPINYKPE